MQRIRDWLYVGGYHDTNHLWYLKRSGISAMLQLADFVPQPDIEILYMPVEDSVPLPAEQIKKGVDFILKQKAAGKIVLVACSAGVSRSVGFAIAALVEAEKRDVLDAYREIVLNHEDADPHSELIVSLSAYYGKKIEKHEATDAIFDIRRELKYARGKS